MRLSHGKPELIGLRITELRTNLNRAQILSFNFTGNLIWRVASSGSSRNVAHGVLRVASRPYLSRKLSCLYFISGDKR
jgi:hypothetical protein